MNLYFLKIKVYLDLRCTLKREYFIICLLLLNDFIEFNGIDDFNVERTIMLTGFTCLDCLLGWLCLLFVLEVVVRMIGFFDVSE